jgi:hypothetical protein
MITQFRHGHLVLAANVHAAKQCYVRRHGASSKQNFTALVFARRKN